MRLEDHGGTGSDQKRSDAVLSSPGGGDGNGGAGTGGHVGRLLAGGRNGGDTGEGGLRRGLDDGRLADRGRVLARSRRRGVLARRHGALTRRRRRNNASRGRDDGRRRGQVGGDGAGAVGDGEGRGLRGGVRHVLVNEGGGRLLDRISTCTSHIWTWSSFKGPYRAVGGVVGVDDSGSGDGIIINHGGSNTLGAGVGLNGSGGLNVLLGGSGADERRKGRDSKGVSHLEVERGVSREQTIVSMRACVCKQTTAVNVLDEQKDRLQKWMGAQDFLYPEPGSSFRRGRTCLSTHWV